MQAKKHAADLSAFFDDSLGNLENAKLEIVLLAKGFRDKRFQL